jgi:MFS family permease
VALPLRRALAALAGSVVAVIIMAVLESYRTHGKLVSEDPKDQLLTGTMFVTPLVVSFALTYAITRWKPGIKSAPLVSLVTLVCFYAGTTAAMAVTSWVMHDQHWHQIFIVGLMAMVFGVIVLGPWAVIGGWLTFYVLDRAAMRSVVPPESELSKS